MSYQSFNTSSAYKLESFEQWQEKKTTHVKRSPKKRVNKKAELVRNVKKYAMIATVVVLAFMIVRGYVALDELDGNITKLKKEYTAITAENQAIQAEIDKNLDLEKLQVVATEEYGMTRPERYQVFYVDIDCCDSGVKVAESEKKSEKASIEGASGMLVDSMNIFD